MKQSHRTCIPTTVVRTHPYTQRDIIEHVAMYLSIIKHIVIDNYLSIHSYLFPYEYRLDCLNRGMSRHEQKVQRDS